MRILLLLFILLPGCATVYTPVPENYTGPVSIIESSEKRHSGSKVDLFYLEKVDGKSIKSSLSATRSATYGQRANLITRLIESKIPSKEVKFTIVGRTEHAMPIQALSDAVYELRGDINFTPKAGERYIVKGVLAKEYSSVWLEIKETGEVVKAKIENHGDSELGFFEK